MITGHVKIDGLIKHYRGPVLIYGEAGTGKTALVLEALKRFRRRGKKIYLATEGASSYQPRIVKLQKLENTYFVEAKDLKEQTKIILEVSRLPLIYLGMVVVDSINALYRIEEDVGKAASMLALQLSLLRWLSERGVITMITGQVHGEGDEASGMWLMEFWAPLVFSLSRSAPYRIIETVKPKLGVEAKFIVEECGIRWV